MDYISRNHSKYLLMAHLIFISKYRKKLLIKYGREIKQIMSDIAKEQDFEILEMEVDKDHVHLLVSYNTAQSILDIVRLLKQISTYRTWRQNNNNKTTIAYICRNNFGEKKHFGAMDILLVV